MKPVVPACRYKVSKIEYPPDLDAGMYCLGAADRFLGIVEVVAELDAAVVGFGTSASRGLPSPLHFIELRMPAILLQQVQKSWRLDSLYFDRQQLEIIASYSPTPESSFLA